MWPEGLGPAEGLQFVKNRSEVSELFQFYIKYNDARNDVVPVQQGGANGLLQGLCEGFPSHLCPFSHFHRRKTLQKREPGPFAVSTSAVFKQKDLINPFWKISNCVTASKRTTGLMYLLFITLDCNEQSSGVLCNNHNHRTVVIDYRGLNFLAAVSWNVSLRKNSNPSKWLLMLVLHSEEVKSWSSLI